MTMDHKKHTLPLVLVMSVAWAGGMTALRAQDEPVEPQGIGLAVEPGGLLIQHVEPGQTYDLAEKSGIALKISNRSTKPRTYLLSTRRPSQVGNRKWLEGYLEIPNPSWFWFEQEEVTVEPESDGYAKMYLRIPVGDQRYDNQHWVVSIGVQGKAQAGEMLALAAYPRYQIETTSDAAIEVAPDGPLGLKPSLLQFEDVSLGTRQKGRMTLYNNESTPQQYTLLVKTISVDPTREQIVPSPGYSWIPELKWLSPRKKRITIKGSESRVVDVKVKVPNKPEYHDKRWEALLWIEPDEGLPRFARIQIDTVQASPVE